MGSSLDLGDAASITSAALACVALFLSWKIFQNQKNHQENAWRRSNTFALLQQWNGEIVRPARSDVYRFVQRSKKDIYTLAEFEIDPQRSTNLQILAHFFDETAKLRRSGYLDEKMFYDLTVEPFTEWKEIFSKFAPIDGDGTIRFSQVHSALQALTEIP